MILQSDNGGEFLGECIDVIKKWFPDIQLVKGRARHPQSQGCIERGNVPFKEALTKWLEENDTTD